MSGNLAAANLKTIVRGAYDIQKLRIQMGNRLVANFKAKLGQKPSESEDEMSDDAKELLKKLRGSYDKITDASGSFPSYKKFKGDELISTYTEACLINQYFELEESEEKHFKQLGGILTEYKIFNEFLDKVRGIGPAMAGVIISEIDISKCKYASSIWKYAGLDVAPDGAGRSRRKEHLVLKKYTDKAGKEAERLSITFNPFLKTKLMGVLATSFLRAGGDSPYTEAYRNYKNRLENHIKWGIKNDGVKNEATGFQITSKGRRHNMSMRFMIKRFLVDLYKNWRKIEGLEVHPEYSEAKLGFKHGEDKDKDKDKGAA